MTAWGEFAPGITYCNHTLAQAASAFQPVFDVRQELAETEVRYTALIARRETNDAQANDLLLRIVNDVKAEPNGENSEVYRGMGYKTKSERSTGLTRKGTTDATVPALSSAS
ncbi:MAG: hypothetical protein EXS27_10435 [Pedosphaera sp.]|nr:hypothetical protein [Pedosphaera sp.]